MMKQNRQRGSALLIVFVFAAIVGILLYREMPVVVFEAHRQKEELLIDRGNEYKHAIRLYVRKVGTFPPSIEALENTNRMRFLRHKFDDPFTGKVRLADSACRPGRNDYRFQGKDRQQQIGCEWETGGRKCECRRQFQHRVWSGIQFWPRLEFWSRILFELRSRIFLEFRPGIFFEFRSRVWRWQRIWKQFG